jgi:hypothetical protein
MLDRLRSGAGAIADIADRIVQAFIRVGRLGPIVAIALLGFGSAVMLGLGIEATDNPEPRQIGSAEVASATDLGRRTYATVSGTLAASYIETYDDVNNNNQRDPDEHGRSWFYWLVDPATNSGVTVRSKHGPDEVYHFEATGSARHDKDYVGADRSAFAPTLQDYSVDLGEIVIDTKTGSNGTAVAYDWSSPPPTETIATVSGTSLGEVGYCSTDSNANGNCDGDEIDGWDLLVYDPATKHGVLVITDSDRLAETRKLTGMLRRDPGAVRDAKNPTEANFAFSDLGFSVSDEYVLEEGGKPLSAPLAFASSGLLALLAVIVLIGWRSGYIVYRREDRPLPSRGRSLGIGEKVPVHVSGPLMGGKGRIRAREASADLVRVAIDTPTPTPGVVAVPPSSSSGAPEPNQLSQRPPPVIRPDGTIGEADAPPADPTAAESTAPPPEPETALVIDRSKAGAGALVGSGAVKGLSVGRVEPLRGPRPAIRVATDAGRLILSFNSVADRDRAVAELLEDNDLSGGLTGAAGMGA